MHDSLAAGGRLVMSNKQVWMECMRPSFGPDMVIGVFTSCIFTTAALGTINVAVTLV